MIDVKGPKARDEAGALNDLKEETEVLEKLEE